MTHPNEESTLPDDLLELVSQEGLAGMPKAIAILLNEAMKIQRSQALGASPYERTDQRTGHANGFKNKTLKTRMGEIPVLVPQTRGIAFYPSALEKGVRSERALKLAVAQMYVQGVSTRKVTAVMQELCGLEVTSSDVSRAAELLDGELESWRNRPLGEIKALFFDARYEKVRHGGSVVSCAVLIACGITPEGKRSVLGVSVSLSEAEVHWREFMKSLQDRGLHGVELIVSDDHAGLKAARIARFAKRDAREQMREDMNGKLYDAKQGFLGKPPSKIPALNPMSDVDKRNMAYAGLDPEEMWTQFRSHQLQSDNLGQVENNRDRAAAEQQSDDAASKLQTRLLNVGTKPELDGVLKDLFKLANDDTIPAAAREHVNALIKDARAQSAEFEAGGLGKFNLAYRNNAQAVAGVGRAFSAMATSSVTRFITDNKGDAFGLDKYLKPTVDDNTGALSFGFPDIDREMGKAFEDQSQALADHLGVRAGKFPPNELRGIADQVIKDFRPRYEQRVKDVETKMQADKAASDAASKKAAELVASGGVTLKGPTGLPTTDSLNLVSSKTGWTGITWMNGYLRNKATTYSTNDVDQFLTLVKNRQTTGLAFGGDPAITAIELKQFYRHAQSNTAVPAGDMYDFNPPSRKIMEDDLANWESDPKLMQAIHSTAGSENMNGYETGRQVAYARSRADYLRLVQAVGIPTEVSTSDTPHFKPEWVNPFTVPMFSHSSDVTNENVDKLIKNLKLTPDDSRMDADFAQLPKLKRTPEAVRELIKGHQTQLVAEMAASFGIPEPQRK